MNQEKAVQILSLKELQEGNEIQEEYLVQSLKKMKTDYWNGVKLVENGVYGSFQMHNGRRTKSLWVAFFLDKQRFVLASIRDENNIFKEIEEKMKTAELEEGVAVFFDNILKEGAHVLEKMEDYLANIEQEIVAGRIDRKRNQAIFECKRTLSLWKHDYMQILNIAEGMNGLGQTLTEECACYFRVYENKVRQITEQIQFLYEEVLHVRDALDAALSYDQNRIMKVFTTVTTIFMPLTLVAGWYGMNFNSMPELKWKYGYLFVALLSIAVIIVCMIFFKKKKLL